MTPSDDRRIGFYSVHYSQEANLSLPCERAPCHNERDRGPSEAASQVEILTMATVSKDSANWRLFGGGGLLVGGLIWLIGEILKYAGQMGVASWLEAIGVIVVGVVIVRTLKSSPHRRARCSTPRRKV